MPLYLYQAAYTPESLAAQIKNPMDRLEVAGGQLKSSGYSFGATMDAVSVTISAGGAIRNAEPQKG